MGEQTSTSVTEANRETNSLIAVERYKFILDKIKYLDTRHQDHFNTVLKILMALITFVVAVIMAGIEEKISLIAVEFSISAAGVMLAFTSFFFLFMSIAVSMSWYNYRDEEVELLNKIKCDLNRDMPELTFKTVMRWNETHLMILLTILSIIGIWTYLCPTYLMKILG